MDVEVMENLVMEVKVEVGNWKARRRRETGSRCGDKSKKTVSGDSGSENGSEAGSGET